MKAIQRVLIQVPQTHDETIKTKSGLELFVDIRYNEVDYRKQTGIVVSAPKKHQDVLTVGSEVWFHQIITNLQKPRRLKDDIYYAIIDDTEENCVTSQIFAYKNNPQDKIKPFGWFILVEPIGGSIKEKPKSNFLEVVSFKKEVDDIGVVKAINKQTSDKYGINIGDTIVYNKSARYAIYDGETMYYRVRPQSVLYKEENDKIKPCGNFVLLDMDKATQFTASGIMLPKDLVEHPNTGKIVSVNSNNKKIPKDLIGKTVITDKNTSYIPCKNDMYFINDDYILAVSN